SETALDGYLSLAEQFPEAKETPAALMQSITLLGSDPRANGIREQLLTRYGDTTEAKTMAQLPKGARLPSTRPSTRASTRSSTSPATTRTARTPSLKEPR